MSDENTNEGDGIKQLRKRHDELASQNEQLLERLASFEAKERASAVANSKAFQDRNLPAGVAKLYNGEDTSDEAVGKWLTEHFGEAPAVSQGQPQVDPNVAAAQRVQAASQGTPPGLPAAQPGQPIMGDFDEIANAISTLPYEELVKLGYMPDTSGTLWDNHQSAK